jgi:hypothetical protein
MVYGWPVQKHETLPEKQTKSKMAGVVVQVAELLTWQVHVPEFNPQHHLKTKQLEATNVYVNF